MLFKHNSLAIWVRLLAQTADFPWISAYVPAKNRNVFAEILPSSVWPNPLRYYFKITNNFSLFLKLINKNELKSP